MGTRLAILRGGRRRARGDGALLGPAGGPRACTIVVPNRAWRKRLADGVANDGRFIECGRARERHTVLAQCAPQRGIEEERQVAPYIKAVRNNIQPARVSLRYPEEAELPNPWLRQAPGGARFPKNPQPSAFQDDCTTAQLTSRGNLRCRRGSRMLSINSI